MEKIDFALASFNNIQSLIKFIDQKTSAVLVISGLIFTGFIQFSKSYNFKINETMPPASLIALIFAILTVITLIVIAYISVFKILKPRKATNYNSNNASVFYSEHLSKLGVDKIIVEYQDIDDETMLNNIIEQLYEISVIYEEKNSALSKVFPLLFASIVFLVIFIISSIFPC